MNYYRLTVSFAAVGCLFLANCLSGCNYEEKRVDSSLVENCQNCLEEIALHSDFPFTVNKSFVKVRIDEESNDLVKMKLYEDKQGNTLGWIIYRPKERKLANVSSYLDSLPLKIESRWLDKYEKCKNISTVNIDRQRIALN